MLLLNKRPCNFEVNSGSNYLQGYVQSHLVDFQRNDIPIAGVIEVAIHYNKTAFENLPELSCYKRNRISLQIKQSVQSIRCTSRPISLSIKAEAELDHLQSQGILELVEYSDWATPIVPVLKHNGRIRIYGDY